MISTNDGMVNPSLAPLTDSEALTGVVDSAMEVVFEPLMDSVKEPSVGTGAVLDSRLLIVDSDTKMVVLNASVAPVVSSEALTAVDASINVVVSSDTLDAVVAAAVVFDNSLLIDSAVCNSLMVDSAKEVVLASVLTPVTNSVTEVAFSVANDESVMADETVVSLEDTKVERIVDSRALMVVITDDSVALLCSGANVEIDSLIGAPDAVVSATMVDPVALNSGAIVDSAITVDPLALTSGAIVDSANTVDPVAFDSGANVDSAATVVLVAFDSRANVDSAATVELVALDSGANVEIDSVALTCGANVDSAITVDPVALNSGASVERDSLTGAPDAVVDRSVSLPAIDEAASVATGVGGTRSVVEETLPDSVAGELLLVSDPNVEVIASDVIASDGLMGTSTLSCRFGRC
jgi:hypothetical protein